MSPQPRKILLGITGGIAAYKSPDLVRRLMDHGAEVQVVMSRGAQEFVTPLTFQAVSGKPVRTDLWDEAAEAAMGHIELARWANEILVAPATAEFMARLAHGSADDLLTTVCLATTAPITLAPAMNRQMWANPATQANVAVLKQRNVCLLGPATGDQACGEVGVGRMVEPAEIAEELFTMRGGPGAMHVLVSGPVQIPTPRGVEREDVESAEQMLQAVQHHVADADIFIAAAAVSDYRADQVAGQK